MKCLKQWSALLLSLVMLAGIGQVPVSALELENAVISQWAREDVQEAGELGIVPDSLPGNYTQSITRGQFCKLAVALYEKVTGTAIGGRAEFADTQDEDIEKIAYLEVVTGYGDGTFGPDDTLTREQAAVILARLMGKMEVTLPQVQTPFTDQASSWAEAGIAQVFGGGIMMGLTSTTFGPYEAYTIEQSIVTMLREYRYVQEHRDTVSTDPSEEPSAEKAGGSCGADAKWSLSHDGVLTIWGSGTLGYYSHGKQPWYALRHEITHIQVEKGITGLCHSAFRDCDQAKTVSLPEGLTRIDGYLFAGCRSLISVTIPRSVTSVDTYYAFSDCDSLKEILVAEGNERCCSVDGVLFTRDGKSLECYPKGKTRSSYTVPAGVENVYNFSGNEYLESIVFPASLKTLTYNAVRDCPNLTDLTASSMKDFCHAVKLLSLEGSEWERYTIHATGETPDDGQHQTPSNDNQTEGTLSNGKEITDENIREILYGLKEQYPEGMAWTNANGYYSQTMNSMGFGCAAFAFICSDAVFGDLPVSRVHSDFGAVQVGDILRINNDTHSVVVLEKLEDSVIVTEGNYNSSIHWGREISRTDLENGNFQVTTRYPR